MTIELVLVFDTKDVDEDEELTLDDVQLYASNLNIDTALCMNGYQGWRVLVLEPEDER
jgi:hypothetical protein